MCSVSTVFWRLMGKTLDPSSTGVDGGLFEKSGAQLARLCSLVDRLMDVTRIRTGSFELYRENFGLSGLIREVVNRFTVGNSAVSIALRLEPRIEGAWDRVR